MTEGTENSFPTTTPATDGQGVPAADGQGQPPGTDDLDRTRRSPFRRHPVRWTVAAGGLAAMLALGSYEVTEAAAAHSKGQGGSGAISGSTRGGPGGSPGGAPPSGEGGGFGGRPGGTAGGTAGTVTSFTDSTITLRERSKATTKVTVTSATVYKSGSTTVTSSAIKQGEFVRIIGSTSKATVTATQVTIGAAPKGAPGEKGSPAGPSGTAA